MQNREKWGGAWSWYKGNEFMGNIVDCGSAHRESSVDISSSEILQNKAVYTLNLLAVWAFFKGISSDR